MRCFWVMWLVMSIELSVAYSEEVARKNGNEFTEAELSEAARNLDSYDRGLTAEWLLSMRRHKRSARVVNEFSGALRKRTSISPPSWWTNRLKHVARGRLRINHGDQLPDELSRDGNTVNLNSKIVALPRSYRDAYALFEKQFTDKSVIVGVSSRQELLPLLIVASIDNGTFARSRIMEVPLATWNPAMAIVSPLGITPDALPAPAIEIFHCENQIIVFADVGNLPTLSIFDLRQNRCSLSFVPIYNFASACLNCSADDLRPSDHGG